MFADLLLAALLVQSAPEPTRLQRYEALYRQSGNSALLWLIAEARAEAGDSDGAIRALEEARDRRLGFQPTPDSTLQKLAGNPRYDRLAWQLANDARVQGGARPFSVLDAGPVVPEGIAADPVTGRIFVGDMAGRKIFVRNADGSWAQFAETGTLRPLGMKVDPANRRLWVAATTVFIPSDDPASGLMEFDLDSGRLVRTVSGPDVASMNDLAIAANGEIFVSDSNGGSVHRLRPGSERLEKVADDPMSYPNGLAVSPDGHSLYVAQGIALRRMDLASGTWESVKQPADLALFALDGLAWHGKDLLAIQNRGGPGRVIRLEFAEDGRSIVRHRILESAHPTFDIPTTGTVMGSRFLFIGNSQLDRLQEDGTVRSPVKPIVVMDLPLGE